VDTSPRKRQALIQKPRPLDAEWIPERVLPAIRFGTRDEAMWGPTRLLYGGERRHRIRGPSFMTHPTPLKYYAPPYR
jgi:hypothetical protein